MIAIPLSMPDNCMECQYVGIRDLVEQHCPEWGSASRRPESCPLREIRSYRKVQKIDRYDLDTYGDDIIAYLIKDGAQGIATKAVEDKMVACSSTTQWDPVYDTTTIMVKMSVMEERP